MTLSPNIKFAFHALALDETRIPFQTTLWFQPTSSTLTNGQARPDPDAWTTILKQVWFSGGHCDVGGGKSDSRLSNIALAWMISQLVQHKILAFDQNYLLLPSSIPSARWATALGANIDVNPTALGRLTFVGGVVLESFKVSLSWLIRNIFRAPKAARAVSGERTPGRYVPVRDFAKRDAPEKFQTNEHFHESLKDRQLVHAGNVRKGKGKDGVYWPCVPLNDFSSSKGVDGVMVWDIPHDNKVNPIIESPASEIESFFKGRIRDPGMRKWIFSCSFLPTVSAWWVGQVGSLGSMMTIEVANDSRWQ
jgi:hypothetical protein